uniref:Uncharacterized protein n=1 Tax=Trichogramma kaykai TaxID=54128 RepID=A0ABD2X5F1_9HYME
MVSRTSGCSARHKHELVSYIRTSRLHIGSRASREITTRERCSATRSDASSRTQAAAGLVSGHEFTLTQKIVVFPCNFLADHAFDIQ